MKYKKLKTLWAAIKAQTGYNEAQVERALDLNQGEIKKMIIVEKSGGSCPPELISLLKIVCTYPWMLKVADRSYDQKYAMREMAVQAVDILVEAKYPSN